jgi:hypothetical protein
LYISVNNTPLADDITIIPIATPLPRSRQGSRQGSPSAQGLVRTLHLAHSSNGGSTPPLPPRRSLTSHNVASSLSNVSGRSSSSSSGSSTVNSSPTDTPINDSSSSPDAGFSTSPVPATIGFPSLPLSNRSHSGGGPGSPLLRALPHPPLHVATAAAAASSFLHGHNNAVGGGDGVSLDFRSAFRLSPGPTAVLPLSLSTGSITSSGGSISSGQNDSQQSMPTTPAQQLQHQLQQHAASQSAVHNRMASIGSGHQIGVTSVMPGGSGSVSTPLSARHDPSLVPLATLLPSALVITSSTSSTPTLSRDASPAHHHLLLTRTGSNASGGGGHVHLLSSPYHSHSPGHSPPHSPDPSTAANSSAASPSLSSPVGSGGNVSAFRRRLQLQPLPLSPPSTPSPHNSHHRRHSSIAPTAGSSGNSSSSSSILQSPHNLHPPSLSTTSHYVGVPHSVSTNSGLRVYVSGSSMSPTSGSPSSLGATPSPTSIPSSILSPAAGGSSSTQASPTSSNTNTPTLH